MGVPAFFRWLSSKYPKIIKPCLEDEPVEINGIEYPGDYSLPNKNGELDNLYLDMNGIVHPCTHPEGRPAPENEDEMMLEVFKYTDRVVTMARPRKLLMIAIDGVAPRAKMNQQRSRRFRSAQDAEAAQVAKEEKIAEARRRGEEIDEAIHGKKAWDTNVITPGTPFMEFLASSLRYWISFKLNSDPAWKDLKVIISDASVPGEGEHKIMELIRSQRNDPEHDPNTSHAIYGLDADLIFLGLATHEPNFRILREDVFAQNRTAKASGLKSFIWLDVGILRQYLEIELDIPRTGFPFDLERAIDDWIFMAFFCGNDFLPHLPSLDVRENGIDVLLKAWRQSLSRMQGYMTCDGSVNLSRVQILLRVVAGAESDIFRRRRDQEARRMANDKARKAGQKRMKNERAQARGAAIAKTRGESAPTNPLDNIPLYTPSGESVGQTHMTNQELVAHRNEITMENQTQVEAQAGLKRPADDIDDDHEAEDNIRLWEPGYHHRYYERKFHTSDKNLEFVNEVVQKYIEGVCWTLAYYYQGCPSWTWYYPYHYAPFAQDMTDLDHLKIEFDGGEPFLPYEQLMSVLPAASSHTLPKVFRPLMSDSDSPIIDFYPVDFPIDMNGKKMAWQGIALLPFIDEQRLLAAVRAKYSELTEAERERNARREPVLLVAPENVQRADFAKLYKTDKVVPFSFKSWRAKGLAGTVFRLEDFSPDKPLICPVSSTEHPDIASNGSVMVEYHVPENQMHKSMILQGYNEPNLVLSYDERSQIISRRNKSDRGDERFDRRGRDRPQEFSEPRPLSEDGYIGFLQHQAQLKAQGYDQQHQGGYGGGHTGDRGGYHNGYQNGYQNGHRNYNDGGYGGFNPGGYGGGQNYQGYQRYQGYQGYQGDRQR
ncbi:5'-3' exoribonuclease 2 [Wickerhamiella sorbophila]|uniref:5'-3' exoribonuclease n=1 Tax=Wickerhamiella sorbophila TaxID=45607 RepID=A0A2T0FFU3_9ASCO|nr:5'-3' exoribonuclease 2 [Wickerhamiella sorbophila]PRT53837.1 5'-3' exoribonuclease 2 [Wickerhamiella sorbophila]